MRFRTFGRLGWQLGEVGYGMWGMGGWSGSEFIEHLLPLLEPGDLIIDGGNSHFPDTDRKSVV